MPLFSRTKKPARLLLSLSLCGLILACSPEDPVSPGELPESESSENGFEEDPIEDIEHSEPSEAPLSGNNNSNSADTAPLETEEQPITGLDEEMQGLLEESLEAQMNKLGSPALAVALVKPGQVVWSKGFGLADRETERKATENTGFLLASISKTLTYVHLLQAYEADLYDLDDNISDYLPFAVTNPNHPDKAISFRMLMAHQSSIRDEDSIDVYSRGSDSPIPLKSFMQDYFAPGGKYYSAEDNYQDYAPGEKFSYSNMGTALAGYLVEAMKNKAFHISSDEELFQPLGMKNTAWLLKDLDQNNLAVPYNSDNSPLLHYTFADYPNGQLRSSAYELGRFLAAVMNNGELEGFQMLKADTLKEVRKVQYPAADSEYGLGFHYEDLGERYLFGHSGSEQGASTAMFYDPETNTGAVVLMNKQDMDYNDLVETLLKAGESL